MSQAKLLKFKTNPTNFLFREFFSLEVNYINPIELPTFPSELQLNSSDIKKSFQRVSAFAVSKYLIEDLRNFSPKNILKNLITLPKQLFITIIQARSKF